MPSRISDARAEPEREDPVKNFASASDPHKLGVQVVLRLCICFNQRGEVLQKTVAQKRGHRCV